MTFSLRPKLSLFSRFSFCLSYTLFSFHYFRSTVTYHSFFLAEPFYPPLSIFFLPPPFSLLPPPRFIHPPPIALLFLVRREKKKRKKRESLFFFLRLQFLSYISLLYSFQFFPHSLSLLFTYQKKSKVRLQKEFLLKRQR